jgi:hypothetical protein
MHIYACSCQHLMANRLHCDSFYTEQVHPMPEILPNTISNDHSNIATTICANEPVLLQNKNLYSNKLLPASFSLDKKFYGVLLKSGGNAELKELVDNAQRNFVKILKSIEKTHRPQIISRIEVLYNKFLEENMKISLIKRKIKQNFSYNLATDRMGHYRSDFKALIVIRYKLNQECLYISNIIINNDLKNGANNVLSLSESLRKILVLDQQADLLNNNISAINPINVNDGANELYDYSQCLDSTKIEESISKIIKLQRHSQLTGRELQMIEKFININYKIKRLGILPSNVEQSCTLECILATVNAQIQKFEEAITPDFDGNRSAEIRETAAKLGEMNRRLSILQEPIINQNEFNPMLIELKL